MAGPAVHKPASRLGPSFGTATQEDLDPFLGSMKVRHGPPLVTSFNILLLPELQPEDEAALAHVFEEISPLAIHRLISEDLLFDAFAIAHYWDQPQSSLESLRQKWEKPHVA